ncbi:helix-turn-helix and zinc ribbon transcriptional regulator [Syntrophotalea carbinolica DSM 2380]|uniref:Helix-turn-helix and zinc ribbon transcriptional regulator n=1 Tax=Syntrophotalea carbinolica (strain DSM 2380 / NBRC 103641 / GraBd1) TaxID=338963 RepID=Q3A257_SYNC1|nr:ArsR family transcriptional regulator [Syntrophotalea carbinolica]ABA89550.2 helix-turn-helix and zinc ribbon transcriptional regulator [Syntrophotalea carbinolica DSM 2380]
MKDKIPPIPAERGATLRRQIMELLTRQPMTAKEISMAIGIGEKQVYPHLEHLQQSLRRQNRSLQITPPFCKKCGFTFAKRTRLKKPGKCPVCRSQTIEEPVFALPEVDS